MWGAGTHAHSHVHLAVFVHVCSSAVCVTHSTSVINDGVVVDGVTGATARVVKLLERCMVHHIQLAGSTAVSFWVVCSQCIQPWGIGAMLDAA